MRIRSRSSLAAWARTVVLISLISEILHIKFERLPERGSTMADGQRRQMALVGFMQAGNATVYAGSWRHPATEHGFLTAGYYEKLGRTLEDGLLRPDVLRRPPGHARHLRRVGRRGGAHRGAAGEARPEHRARDRRRGHRNIGLGATYSTTYYSPFHVARTFATLDHLSGGRAAWNVVTSVNDSEAQNYGLKEASRPRRALRPRRRVPRGDDRVVGQLGRRRAGARPRDAALRRSRQGPRARLRRASGSTCGVR